MLFTEEAAYFNGAEGNGGGGVATTGTNGNGPPHASKLNTWAGNKRANSKEANGPAGGFNGTDDEKSWANNRHTPADLDTSPDGTCWSRRGGRWESRIKGSWSDPLQDQMAAGSLENEFTGMSIGEPPKGPHNGMPPQWGRAEVNQTTPWELDRQAGFQPDPMPTSGPGPRFMQPFNMDNGTGHWRSWDHDGGFQKEFHGGPGGFPPMGVPNKMPGQFYAGGNNFVMPNFNDRMMRNGPPHMGQQQHSWMGDKFGGRGGFPQPSGFGGPPQPAGPLMGPMGGHQRGFMPPPPPLGAAPHVGGPGAGHHAPGPHGAPTGGHPSHHHGGPPNAGPPPMHPLAGAGPGKGGPNEMGGNFIPTYGVHGQGNFDVGTFKASANMVNDDAVWHDPNGYLRKWQRDTGTAAWGDPSKQGGQQIRRWQNVDENDPLSTGAMPIGSAGSAPGMLIGPIGSGPGSNVGGTGSRAQQSSPDSLKKEDDEIPETGWGELPPLNGASAVAGGPTLGGGPMMPGPPPGPPPMSGGHQPTHPVGGSAWMGGAPGGGPMNPQSSMAQTGVSGWADSQQRSLASNNFIPPGNPFPSNSHFYNAGNAGAGMPPAGEWGGRPPFGNAGAVFDGGMSNNGPPGSTNEIAEKLRLAAAKGLINPVLFCNSGKLSTQTASLLNTMINLLTEVEQQDLRIEHMKRNGGIGTPEFERLVRETSDAKNQLSDLRDKIHSSIDGRQKGVSLADELTDINTMPMSSEGPMFLNF